MFGLVQFAASSLINVIVEQVSFLVNPKLND